MKRLFCLSLCLLLLCSILGGCRSSAGGQQNSDLPNTTDATQLPQETAQKETLPIETIPQESVPTLVSTVPTLPIETIPQSTDDSDYQLPPGEQPTTTPEIE